MPLLYAGDVFVPGVAFTLLGYLDNLIVPAGSHVISSGNTGVVGNDVPHVVTVAGLVAGDVDGVHLGFHWDVEGLHRVKVMAGGVISGMDDGVEITGASGRIENLGTITGSFGVFIQADLAYGETMIVNHGVISGERYGVYLQGNQTKVLHNFGVLEGWLASYHSEYLAADQILNSGLMRGDVQLGLGDDLYDGTGGRVVGVILGETGADRFIPGASAEVFDGGEGSDLLDFRRSNGVKVALDGSLVNTGTASGDSYIAIERIYGSLIGGDTLIGSGASNALTGYGGADVLKGGGGNDLLNGGVGKDSLTGGLGNDAFVFKTAAEGGDLIADFSNGAGNNDRFNINAADFGGGLVAGTVLLASQFQSRADNLAQDLDDRFIFRTSDATLWFDGNGNWAGGLSMVANLQAGAVVTNLDILLV